MSGESNAGWLTLHEVLDVTGLPYRDVTAMAEDGRLPTRDSGAALLFDPTAVERLRLEQEPEAS